MKDPNSQGANVREREAGDYLAKRASITPFGKTVVCHKTENLI